MYNKHLIKFSQAGKVAAYALAISGLFSFKGCFHDPDNEPNPPGSSGTYKVTIENVAMTKKFFAAGSFKIPEGDLTAGPATPGKSFKFSFNAPKGSKLSFATMFGQSNDLFYAPGEEGIALYNGNEPISGDVTDQIKLWDAGTEKNEEPGVGAYQAPRQSDPNMGMMESATVKEISTVGDGYTYPAVNKVINVMVKHISGSMFEVYLKNVSTSSTLQTSKGPAPAPHSPGIWVIHTANAPLFMMNKTLSSNGLERIAEDGDPTAADMYIMKEAGYVSPLSPGVWAIHKENEMPVFKKGMIDFKEGLEGIAEDANPEMLAVNLMKKNGVKSSGIFSIPVGKAAPGPIMPGEKFEFEIKAGHGDRLFFATMLGQSNDIFLSPMDNGIPIAKHGENQKDVSSMVYLWDAGTEVNEYPGAGINQAPRQSGPNTGPSESNPIVMISEVKDGFTYPKATDIIKVTITKMK